MPITRTISITVTLPEDARDANATIVLEGDCSAGTRQRGTDQPILEVPGVVCRTGGVGFGGGIAVRVIA